ncbi:nucleotidyltransferase family protein [Thalassotalea sediminis]|uniref:nucleotidyltransferase family protein n=1 Tax=Thalassotalea sediminis TaxID=1759089 RepID=UPI002573599F|nr:nucleotidyltransferase family protein [Thalassotalea sediminis]
MAHSALNSTLAIIILAGGSSSRLGQAKQLVKVQNETLIAKQCHLALSVTSHVYVVVGCQAQVIAHSIEHLPVHIVNNLDWQLGMGSSITHGIKALPNHITAVMLLLVDQWQLTPKLLNTFVQAWRRAPEKIHCATKTQDNVQGPPVIFPYTYFRTLSEQKPSSGAKRLLKKHMHSVISLPLDEAFVDLDTPKQLAQCLNYYQTMNSDLA